MQLFKISIFIFLTLSLNKVNAETKTWLPSEIGTGAFSIKADTLHVYKKVMLDGEEVELKLHTYLPEGFEPTDKRPAAVMVHGGGWYGGGPDHMGPQCRYLALRGMVAFSVEYRTINKFKTTPKECVTDGKSALRWVTRHAAELGVDPDRIVAGGGSAGGHVAAAMALVDAFNEEGEDTSISSVPKALLLYNPVYDNGPNGFGHGLVKEYWKEISPIDNIDEQAPPTLVFLGTKDEYTPAETAERYKSLMEAKGRRCDLHLYPDEPHGFFNLWVSKDKLAETLIKVDRFLVSLGFLEGEPILKPKVKPNIVVILATEAEPARPFGDKFPQLESRATGDWWTKQGNKPKAKNPYPSLDVPRNEVLAFALYTQDRGVLKLTAQLFPLKPGEDREVRLEFKKEAEWIEVAKQPVLYPGWSAHFRMENWDASQDVPYRVRHGKEAMFEGLIRKDPADKEEILVANLSCDSSSTLGPRAQIVKNLIAQDPDLLFFAGDQSYRHHEATVGWLEFGLHFREVMKDRPTITIPDDHDVGHGNLWGESGKVSTIAGNADGGYKYPGAFVNMVERQQTWHLPDPVDPEPIAQGIGVYFTRLVLGGIDFAILEDRKFKSGPAGKIPKMGPRPDHINDPNYDPKTIDLPGLELLGPRQEKFLQSWSENWSGAEMKVVLSQTAFCGAVHIHGHPNNRLLADLDCNGWPQTPRKRALELIRQAGAVHLCGDQHLGVVVKHGIDEFGDGPYAFTSPAIVNTIYGRWWKPEDEQAGPNPVEGSPLPWTGDFLDGLGNKISMMAYANPPNRQVEQGRADGYGMARFNRKDRTVTFEAWPRFSSVEDGDKAQFPGWPLTLLMEKNDGRKVTGYLPGVEFDESAPPVFQVIDESGKEILYTTRAKTSPFKARVYSEGPFTLKSGQDRPEKIIARELKPADF